MKSADNLFDKHRNCRAMDNGFCYISGDLTAWLEDHKMDHVRGTIPPETQGRSPLIDTAYRCRAAERWHQTLKNRALLENYYLPGDPERQIGAFVGYYHDKRYHESLSNVTPADIHFRRGETLLRQRERIKRKTIEGRRLLHRKSAA